MKNTQYKRNFVAVLFNVGDDHALTRITKKKICSYCKDVHDSRVACPAYRDMIISVDLAYRLKWWQRLLVLIGIRKRSYYQDYSCSTIWKKNKDGTIEIVDINYF